MTEETDSQSYFHAVEEAFVRLRGSPLLLSPADWKTAQRWRQLGIPLEFVLRALEEVFDRRRERGRSGKVNSLRYCAQHVEKTWSEVAELLAPGRRDDDSVVDVGERLERLADALPLDWSETPSLVRSIRALAGSSELIEGELSGLDGDMLRRAAAALEVGDRQALAARVEARLRSLADRLEPRQLARVRGHLESQEIRAQLSLPVLSLFSDAAQQSG